MLRPWTISSDDIKSEHLNSFNDVCRVYGEVSDFDGKPFYELDVSVEGSYIPFSKGNFYYPDEGGYFEELFVYHGKVDITEWITEKTLRQIEERIGDESY